MQAVFQLSGFQYRAEEGGLIRVPLQKIPIGETFDIDDVLLISDKESTLIGTPTIEGAKIEAELVAEDRYDKTIVYKFKRRTKYRRTQGHRQPYSEIRIKKIVSPD